MEGRREKVETSDRNASAARDGQNMKTKLKETADLAQYEHEEEQANASSSGTDDDT